MTFVLLSRVLLWLLLGAIIVSLFQRFPSGTFVGRLLLVIVVLIVVLTFLNPREPVIAELWRVVSFPLRPLGAAILLLIFSAQRIKGGSIDKPGGYLVGWALTILLLASTPAFGFLLTRTPVASAPQSEVLVAWGQESTTPTVSDVVGDSILSSGNMGQATIAFNSLGARVMPYLLQTPTPNPREITRRGLRLEDFVPNAQTLALTTQVWDGYLNRIYVFLRSGR
ncbi:MAG: hypothetical protein DSM106950_31370 [Stigonema ocellatum SAG 48.90 = DSM 106950]|nr:hypothetical protein [Stigonema ocellatum SAG 48.90 = DSM 106950]